MLILTRRPGEALVIGTGADAVKVYVLGNKGNQTRLGVDGPKHIAVDREEIAERKAQQGAK